MRGLSAARRSSIDNIDKPNRSCDIGSEADHKDAFGEMIDPHKPSNQEIYTRMQS